ncbi:MAG TPA: hypothetical protein VED40_08295 [Azospirillaceae bacterium]|nr:hypothetical protein [Azospirillaceae bacterium]
MDLYTLLLLAHILLFVYWLGGDLGVYYSSGYISRPSVTPATRAVVAKIMLALDMTPRICLVLMLPVGVTLSHRLGVLALPDWAIPVLWVLSIFWLAMVWTIYVREHQPLAHSLTRVDWVVRLSVIAALLAVAVLGLIGQGPVTGGWISLKILIFALIIASGLAIRVMLKPFGAAFGRLMKEGSNPEIEAELAASLARVKPPVLVIWAGLVVNAWLGLAKPF